MPASMLCLRMEGLYARAQAFARMHNHVCQAGGGAQTRMPSRHRRTDAHAKPAGAHRCACQAGRGAQMRMPRQADEKAQKHARQG
eukprot:351266-Chlamydomonas_euryale.AAC.2